MPTVERTVNLEIKEARPIVKDSFIAKGCKVLHEEPHKQIKLRQGSLWGITPKSAKKTITITLEPKGSQTRISASSKLASDWKNITIVGCIFALALAVLCGWMATDLANFSVMHTPSFWSWITTFGGNVNLQATQSLINLAWSLTVFLSAVVLLEIAIASYAHIKLNITAEESLNKIGNT